MQDPAVMDAPPTLTPIPQPHGGAVRPRITSADAAIMGRRGAAATHAIIRARKAAIEAEMVRQLAAAAIAKTAPAPQAATAPPTTTPAETPTAGLLDLPAIARTRAQIAAVDAAIDAALVPRQPCEHCGQVAGVSSLDLDRLARAKTSLREDLRLLLDKPLPGSRRPDSGPSRRGRVETLLE